MGLPLPPAWADIAPTDSGLTLFQKILLVTDGTVTELLSLYCGQSIIARKLDQSSRDTPDAMAGAAAVPPPLLLRTVLLETAAGRPLLHATSCFCLDSMPTSIRHDLVHTDRPIGLLWRRERLEMYREVLACRAGRDAALAHHLQVPADTPLLARRYRLFHGGKPSGAIEETFATTILY